MISEYIAPWALPSEDIPIHFHWMPEPSLEAIRIELPPKFSVVEVLNADEYSCEYENNQLSIDSSALKSDNYFGMVVRCTKKYRKTLAKCPIKVSFTSRNEELSSRILEATIVRPKLKVVDAPRKLTIDDKVNPRKLFNLTVAHFGLGTAEIKMQVVAEGQTVSSPDSLYLEILHELCEEILGGGSGRKEEIEPVDHGFRLDERWLQDTTQAIADQIQKGHVPPEMKREAIQEVLRLLASETERERILKAIYSRLRRLVLGALLYYLDRYPEEDIYLPYGRIRTIFRSEVKRLKVRLKYNDSMGNRYSPIQVIIDIDDRRTHKDKIFQAPINVAWKREQFQI